MLGDFTFISENKIVLLVVVAVVSFVLTYFSIPNIIRISNLKGLKASSNERSSHENEVPHLAGFAIFYSIIICSTIFAPLLSNCRFLYPSLIILFFIGINDDFLNIKPIKKLLFQITAALLITIGSDVRIKSFFGILGIHEINYYLSVLFSVFVFIAIINAYNLIDGIDGLAACIAILACFSFIYVFYKLNDYSLIILCVSIITSLVAFLRYNFSSTKKIFMGDTGSMIIGFLLSFMAIKFINLCSFTNVNYENSPGIAIAILIVPIADTLNVMILRILNRESIFTADKRHIHHKLLRLNLSHIQATVTICVFYLFILCVAFLLRDTDILVLIFTILSLGFIFAISPNIINRIKEKKNNHKSSTFI